MRYLHPLSPVERFIASGTYRDHKQNPSQKWTIHQLPDQAWIIRIDHIFQNILIQAWRSPESQLERVDIRTLNPPPRRINYLVENGLIEYGHHIKNASTIQQTFDLPMPKLVLPSVIGISLALREWRSDSTLVTLDLSTFDLMTFQVSVEEWRKPVTRFNAQGVVQHYQDQSGVDLLLTDFAAHHSFNLSQRENS